MPLALWLFQEAGNPNLQAFLPIRVGGRLALANALNFLLGYSFVYLSYLRCKYLIYTI